MSKDSLSKSQTPQDKSPSHLTAALKVIGVVIAAVAIFFVSQVLAVIVFSIGYLLAGKEPEQIESLLTDSSTAQLVLTILLAGSIALLLRAVFRYRKEPFLKTLKLDHRPTQKQIFEVGLMYVAYFLVMIFVVVVVDALTPVNVNQDQQLDIASPKTFIDNANVFVMLVLLTPVYEEVIFRGFMYRYMRRSTSIIVAGIIASVIFGLAHLEYNNLNWIAAIDTLVFSGFLIYLLEKHDSLYSPILLHMLKNSVAFYFLFVRG